MDLVVIFDAAGKWGLGIVLSIIMAFMFNRSIKKSMDSMTEERMSYKNIIDKQDTTINNHISHLSENVIGLSEKMGSINVSLAEQGIRLEKGFDKVVEAIKVQTEALKKPEE